MPFSLHTFAEAFLPLFVAIDAIGLAPLFLNFTGGMNPHQRRRIASQAMGTALIIAFCFMFVGQAVFNFLHITSSDFRIGGGILLLVFAVLDLLKQGKPAVHEPEIVGIVPIATPLIVGPATLTTLLVLSTKFGHFVTTLALLANFVLLAFILLLSTEIQRIVSTKALLAISKIITILLAAIAVNFIRTGIFEILRLNAQANALQ